jgi:hypothetical protein
MQIHSAGWSTLEWNGEKNPQAGNNLKTDYNNDEAWQHLPVLMGSCFIIKSLIIQHKLR